MYKLLITIAHVLIFLVARLTIKGREHIPSDGPLLLVSNHLSIADPVLLGAKAGRRVTFMAKEELFKNKFTTYFIKSFGSVRFIAAVRTVMLYIKHQSY
jgi:1-acyl-sn-glycerol-3-phosphate acyltransferase